MRGRLQPLIKRDSPLRDPQHNTCVAILTLLLRSCVSMALSHVALHDARKIARLNAGLLTLSTWCYEGKGKRKRSKDTTGPTRSEVAMAFQLNNMTPHWRRVTTRVRYVVKAAVNDYLSITVMRLERTEDCFARTAIQQSACFIMTNLSWRMHWSTYAAGVKATLQNFYGGKI